VIPSPKSYYQEWGEAKGNAAEEQYGAGLAAMEIKTRESAKDAYYHFVQANEYQPGYKDVNDRLVESKYHATLKVVVDQIPAITRYELSARFFQDNVESFLRTNIRNQFVRFYSFEEAEEEKVNPPDQVLRIYFEDFVVGQVTMLRSEKEVTSADSVKVGELELEDGTVVEVRNKVKAKLITYKKEVKSSGRLGMEIIDGFSNGVLSSKKFNGEFVWVSEWGSFNGDGRALTKAQKNMTVKEEVPPPPNDQMFIEFTKPIYDQLTGNLQRYYSQF